MNDKLSFQKTGYLVMNIVMGLIFLPMLMALGVGESILAAVYNEQVRDTFISVISCYRP